MNFIFFEKNNPINKLTRLSRSISFLLCFLLSSSLLFAQDTTVKGLVKDADTGEPLISAAVNFQGTSVGVNTDFDGMYELTTSGTVDSIVITYLGYQTLTKAVKRGKTQTINVKLSEDAINLQTAVVTQEKEKYRNKDNPAVALIKKVIEQKEVNRASNYDFYEYEKYEKILLGLSGVTEKFKKRKVFKKIQFLFEEMDTTSIPGEEVLPIYIKESLSEVRYRKKPEKTKEIILADTMVTFEGYADDDGFNQYLNNLYQNIDIYDNNTLIMTQQFMSPVADAAPTFYKYYIEDTLRVDGVECIELFFAPRNKLDILFQGSLFIAYKDNYNIKKVDMSINSNVSLNWVKAMNLVQEFEKQDGHGYVQVTDQFSADFGLTKRGMGMFGSRKLSNKKVLINQPRPDEDYKGLKQVVLDTLSQDSETFWDKKRHGDLTASEAQTYQKIDSLKNVKVFKRVMNIATLALSGYTNIGKKFEIGPVNTFYSFNPIEGFRLRLGGRTRFELSERFQAETYAAYGFKDERWKGFLGLSYALKNGNLQKFPVRRIRISGQQETKIPGLELEFVQEDNILLSFKRGTNNKYLYNNIYLLEYQHEFKNHFMFSLGLKSWSQEPAGDLIYRVPNGGNDTPSLVDNITTSEIQTVLRWAPNEQFYQGKTYRIPIVNKYPVFTFRHNLGLKNFLGGEYNYQFMSLRITKHFFLSRLGQGDFLVEGGMILGDVPHPLMMIHRGNQTYSYQTKGFNMMNFYEFVSDRYFTFNYDHDFGGLLLNRLPLIKKLKWREVFNVRVLYGEISDRNNPNMHDDLIEFPRGEDGGFTTFALGNEPYIEGSIGVANVFKFFRIDLVRRFTYLDNPVVAEYGIRARFKVYF